MIDHLNIGEEYVQDQRRYYCDLFLGHCSYSELRILLALRMLIVLLALLTKEVSQMELVTLRLNTVFCMPGTNWALI